MPSVLHTPSCLAVKKTDGRVGDQQPSVKFSVYELKVFILSRFSQNIKPGDLTFYKLRWNKKSRSSSHCTSWKFAWCPWWELREWMISVDIQPGPHDRWFFDVFRPNPGAPISNSQKVLSVQWLPFSSIVTINIFIFDDTNGLDDLWEAGIPLQCVHGTKVCSAFQNLTINL